MSLQDSNAERRNLTLISLSFIIYIIGEGSLTENELRLQVISVTFRDIEALTMIVWAAFAWCLYRYAVVNRGAFVDEYSRDINSLKDHRFLISYLNHLTGKSIRSRNSLNFLGGDSSLVVESLHRKGLFFYARICEKKINISIENKVSGERRVENGLYELVRLGGIRGFFVSVRLLFSAAIFRPSFFGYISPYLLSFFAIFLAIDKYICKETSIIASV
ncbi:hypothetical protein [Pseudoalteromonas ruthenica]|uniref:hypothetical protein n=1 Tax=Pseudoalteromonas ruthenica TaxID=151081 RepID=UPI00241E72BB|nr:hypothetical protein [Pseudoalteromonas ruthenica]|tara:strand:+ start:1387 stop:2040 length:654 start_codon:yes stop_codon:yes gene_type:complete